MFCETWKGTFQILAPAVWVFVSVLSPFFLFLVIFCCQYCLLYYFSSLLLSFVFIHIISPIIFAFFLSFFLTLFLFFPSFFLFTLFPFLLLPSFRWCTSFLSSICSSILSTHPSMSRSFFVFFFTFLCISAPYSSQLLRFIPERLGKSLGLNKSTGMYEYKSRCLIQEQYPSVCKSMSFELRRPSVWMFYYCRSPKGTYISTIFAVASFTMAIFRCSFCHTFQFTTGFGHEAWFMTPEELVRQSIRRIYCSRRNAACLRSSGSSSLHFSSAGY